MQALLAPRPSRPVLVAVVRPEPRPAQTDRHPTPARPTGDLALRPEAGTSLQRWLDLCG